MKYLQLLAVSFLCLSLSSCCLDNNKPKEAIILIIDTSFLNDGLIEANIKIDNSIEKDKI